MATELLSISDVRKYVSDYSPNNYLIDGEEFSDGFISLCRDLAMDSYNIMPPASQYDTTNFPSKSLLLYGTMWHMYTGKAALLARNTMSYSDGGISLAIEERSELYRGIASSFQSQFIETGKALKISINMESGWSSVSSDDAMIPLW